MNFNIRHTILFLFLLSTLHSTGQDTAVQIMNKWLNLKTQFIERANVVNDLTKALTKSKIDKKQISNLKNAVIEMSNHVDTLQFVDSVSVSLVEVENNKLIHAMQEVLIGIESESVLTKQQAFIDFQMRLERSENGIAVAMNYYNETCRKFQRIDLIFHRRNQNEAVEIKF